MTSEIDKIKHLRDATGLSLGEIKKALDEAGGDQTKAKELLDKIGLQIAAKKSARQVKEGSIAVYIHNNKKLAAVVELLCETDFVGRNNEFQALAHDLAMHVAAMKPGDVNDLLAQPYIKNPDLTVQEYMNQSIAKLGENIQIGRFELFEI